MSNLSHANLQGASGLFPLEQPCKIFAAASGLEQQPIHYNKAAQISQSSRHQYLTSSIHGDDQSLLPPDLMDIFFPEPELLAPLPTPQTEEQVLSNYSDASIFFQPPFGILSAEATMPSLWGMDNRRPFVQQQCLNITPQPDSGLESLSTASAAFGIHDEDSDLTWILYPKPISSAL